MIWPVVTSLRLSSNGCFCLLPLKVEALLFISLCLFAVLVTGAPQEFKMENPFQSVGPKEVLEVDTLKDGILVRVAMPGVGEDGIKVWLENNTVYFTGKGEIEVESEESGRKYGGSLEFSTDCCKAEKVEAQMKNGILRMVIKGEMGQD